MDAFVAGWDHAAARQKSEREDRDAFLGLEMFHGSYVSPQCVQQPDRPISGVLALCRSLLNRHRRNCCPAVRQFYPISPNGNLAGLQLSLLVNSEIALLQAGHRESESRLAFAVFSRFVVLEGNQGPRVRQQQQKGSDSFEHGISQEVLVLRIFFYGWIAIRVQSKATDCIHLPCTTESILWLEKEPYPFIRMELETVGRDSRFPSLCSLCLSASAAARFAAPLGLWRQEMPNHLLPIL